jgi:hypothetical protein
MEAPNKQIRPRVIAVVLLGDMSVFLAFVILGKTEHGIIQSRALLRTALPFAIVWCAISPWLGAYRASTLYNLRTTAWRMPLIWLLCGFVALFARALLTDRPLTLAFAFVAIAVQGALLVSWRGVFMMVTSCFSRP